MKPNYSAINPVGARLQNYRQNRDWSDPYIAKAKEILGRYTFQEAPFEIDAHEATDLVLVKPGLRVAFRMRRDGYAARYPWQFTIRNSVLNGGLSELQKYTDGHCDWMFYGHADQHKKGHIARWLIIDLAAWRAHMIRNRKRIKKGNRANSDGTSFTWFDIRSFPSQPPLLIGASHPLGLINNN